MKIAIAPDKFKNSLSGIEFCNAVEKGLKRGNPDVEVIKIPLADGGDGTVDVLNFHLQGEIISTKVKDPLFRKIKASYFLDNSTKTAFVEMAQASGLKLLTKAEQNCYLTTTYGTGQLIKNAINKGAKNIILGIGGSATNDCGIGMAKALGFKFLDKFDKEVIPIGKNLANIKKIDTTEVLKDLKKTTFKIACDVANPLYGKNGAAFVYAPQKGVNSKEIILLDKGLQNMAEIFLNQFNSNVQNIKGAGAAGGLGAGALIFLHGQLVSGIELIKELVKFETKIQNANWIITGEGKLDKQTFSGKTIQGVISSAKKHNIPIAAFCGSTSLDREDQKLLGLTYVDSTINFAKNMDDSLHHAKHYLSILAEKFIKNKILN